MRTIVINSLEEMCDLVCGGVEKDRTHGDDILDLLPSGAEVYTRDESMDAVVIKIPKAWWEGSHE